MTLPYGATLCDGATTPLAPGRPMHLCRDCLRRITPPQHAWQKYLKPVPAKHDGTAWVCNKRIEK